MLFQVTEACVYATAKKCVIPTCHIPSVSCCASAAPDTDSQVCFERGWLGCVHSEAGPSLSGSVPAASVGVLVSFAQLDAHPARHGDSSSKEIGRGVFAAHREEAKPKDILCGCLKLFFIIICFSDSS